MRNEIIAALIGSVFLISALMAFGMNLDGDDSSQENETGQEEQNYPGVSITLTKENTKKSNQVNWDSSKVLVFTIAVKAKTVDEIKGVDGSINATFTPNSERIKHETCDPEKMNQILVKFRLKLNIDEGLSSGTVVGFSLKVTVNSDGKDTTYTLNVSNITVCNPFLITVGEPQGGRIVASPGQALEGAEITLNYTPDEGYIFVEWISDDVTVGDNNTFVMPAKDVDISAKFLKNDYVLSCKEATSFGGNTVIDIEIKKSSGARTLDDPRLFVIAKYDDYKVINAYCSVDLAKGGRLAVSSQGLTEVIVELVDGISDGLPDYCGVVQHVVTAG